MVASYVNSWFAQPAADSTLSSAGAMCGTDIVGDLLYQGLGVACSSFSSKTDCMANGRCNWMAGPGNYYGYGCDTYGCYTGYHFGPSNVCREWNVTSCTLLGRDDCGQRVDCVWDGPGLWCYSRNVTVQDMYLGCTGSQGSVQCGMLPLDNWTGTLAGGGHVFESRRMSGQAFRPLAATATCSAAGTVPLVRLGCDMRLDIMPGTPVAVAAYLPQLQVPVAAVADAIMRFAADCSATSQGLPPLTENQFSAAFR